LYGDYLTVCSFLRGLFSANGGVITSGKRISFKSFSKKLIEQMQILLSSVGILSYYTTNTGHNVLFKNGTYYCKESYDINIIDKMSLQVFNTNIGFIQKYKTKALLEILNKGDSRSKINYDIRSVEYVTTDDVFDITVDGANHTYWSGGCNISNCGEICLESNYGSCCLGSIVLSSFVTKSGNTNWKELEDVIKLSVRFLDNVLTVNKYHLKENEVGATNSRRIGLGVMGLGTYFFMKKIRYGSEKSILEIDKLFKFIRDIAYLASIELAVEKGAFPKFDSTAYGKASFIRKLPVSIRLQIKKHGIRNVTLLTAPPTGSTSLICDCTSGIEPLPVKAYRRKDRVGERIYIHPTYSELLQSGENCPDWFVDSYDLRPEDHLEVQSAIQRYLDGAISKTVLLPKNTTREQLSDLLLAYITNLKGVTIYVDGSREGQIINKMTKEEVLLEISNNTQTNFMDESDMKCRSGVCEL
jgi:ribonucleotide reductase alpha subunit